MEIECQSVCNQNSVTTIITIPLVIYLIFLMIIE